MISILFAARNSIYNSLTDSAGEPLDCWDEDRDAMKWPGGNPVVAHPPCRLWSKWLKQFSTAPQSEKELARFAVRQVRESGGVLEHPACSGLWEEQRLPLPGRSDQYGVCLAINQMWFGHAAIKATWLYVCGTKSFPETPFVMGYPDVAYTWRAQVKNPNLRRLSGNQRIGTPVAFARWLVETAERCNKYRKIEVKK